MKHNKSLFTTLIVAGLFAAHTLPAAASSLSTGESTKAHSAAPKARAEIVAELAEGRVQTGAAGKAAKQGASVETVVVTREPAGDSTSFYYYFGGQ